MEGNLNKITKAHFRNYRYIPYFSGSGYQYPGGYNQQGQWKKYGSNSSPSFTDQISNSIKSIGTDILKNALAKAITGGRK